MIEEDLSLAWVKYARGLASSIVVGFLGGVVCGAVILSLCGLAGRSGTTGADYVGYWSFGLALVGAMYGGPIGAIVGPLGYLTFVREIGFRSAMLPAAIGTVAGGFAGSLVTPGFGIPTAIVGFLIGLFFAKRGSSTSNAKRSSSSSYSKQGK
jgi:hypothetical protein